MIHLLVAYGADPLVRLQMHDFPGQQFTQYTGLPVVGESSWSSPDYRVGLLHLAVVRGDLRILEALIPV